MIKISSEIKGLGLLCVLAVFLTVAGCTADSLTGANMNENETSPTTIDSPTTLADDETSSYNDTTVNGTAESTDPDDDYNTSTDPDDDYNTSTDPDDDYNTSSQSTDPDDDYNTSTQSTDPDDDYNT